MNNIKRLRQNQGLTLIEISERLNNRYGHLGVKFSKETIRRWEDGKSSPSIDHASALADFFDVTLDELAGRKEVEKPSSNSALAAHIREDATEEEIREIQKFIDYTFHNRDN